MNDTLMNPDPTNEESKKRGRGVAKGEKRGAYKKTELKKKITVKHYLQTNVKDAKGTKIVFDNDGENDAYFPIYVQVMFDKNTTFFRSETSFKTTIQGFTLLMNKPNGRFFVTLDREKRLIEYVLQEDYKRYVTKDGEFPNGNLELFESYNGKKILDKYDYRDFSMEVFVQEKLRMFTIDAVIKLGLSAVEESMTKDGLINDTSPSTGIEGLNRIANEFTKIAQLQDDFGQAFIFSETLSYIESFYPQISEIRKEFAPQTFFANIFFRNLKKSDYFKYLFPNILDLIDGTFEYYFLEHFRGSNDESSAKAIWKDIQEKFMFNLDYYFD